MKTNKVVVECKMRQPLFYDLDKAKSALRKSNLHVLEYFLDHWDQYEPYADENFRNSMNRAINTLHDRVHDKAEYIKSTDTLVELSWEMTSALALMDLGFELVPTQDKGLNTKDANLDHLMMVDGKRVWIECVTPSRGEDDTFPNPEAEGGFTVPVDAMMLRLTNSIHQKAGPPRSDGRPSQIRKFFDAYPQYSGDSVLLAICTGNLRFDSCGSRDIPIACKCVFGFGNQKFSCPKRGGPTKFLGYEHVPHITKSNGIKISMESFKADECDLLTGLLYAVYSPFSVLIPSFHFIENPKALNPPPPGMSSNFIAWTYNMTEKQLTRTPPTALPE